MSLPDMPPPLIGVTTHPPTDPDRANLDALVAMIVRAVERAGGAPVPIPLGLSRETLRALYARLDGVLFSGGGDVEPALYGADAHPAVVGVSAERDDVEITLMRWAVNDERPLFGICRGTQVLNVALGGTLYRDLAAELPDAQRHNYSLGFPLDLCPHPVRVEEDSALARLLREPILAVNSLHHQACRDLAPGLRAAARAPDGIVEALELPAHPFALAVQWHPECLPDAPAMRRLFEAFVAAAAVKTASK
jgi:putative glutamine amidotransferase